MRFLWLLLFGLLAQGARAQGLADWQHDTPGGNRLGDVGTGTFLQPKGAAGPLLHVRQWYFYRNHVVGQTNRQYFVFKETDGSLKLFDKEEAFQQYLTQQGLKPALWTRWYSDNWVATDALGALLVAYFFISIPVALGFIWAVYAVAKLVFKVRAPLTVALLAGFLLLLLVVLSGEFPQSV